MVGRQSQVLLVKTVVPERKDQPPYPYGKRRVMACYQTYFGAFFGQQNQVFQMVKGMQTSMELEYFQLSQDQHERWL